ncbi:glycosyltransferase family 4 protein [Synechocystis sp. PCC 7339]|uniref:glycosyltransferase family 4 protein n=1 Tax=Synechocystis sp. PCC 7339 TaxID=2782213 RepID=UPI001CBFF968|nr:glycosyltransferase family 4 protein [Synechocystis sp. PCC 7339]UAJ72553.1 glycosyltransferase family 4 protein [Synechocystis sp. PCC 7339]
MKLTILNQFYPPDYAATGQLLEELSIELSKKELDVQIFAGQSGYAFDQELAPAQEMCQGVLIRRTRTSRLWPQRLRGRAIAGILYCLRAIVKLRLRNRLGDLILVTTEPPYLMVVAYILHLLYRKPYICLIYDLYPDVAVKLGVAKEKDAIVKLWRWLNRLTWQKAEAIIVLSESMAKVIVDQQPALTEKIKVVHNWADGVLIQPRAKIDNWFAQRHGLDQTFTVLYSGNMGRCHDLETIMEAARLLSQQAVQFVFIGAGAKAAICRNFVQRHQLTNCLFLPFQPKQVLPFSLTACDLSLVSILAQVEGLVVPSKFYGCLAAGTAIAAICPSHSYLRGIIADAQCGVAIDNGDGEKLAQFILQLKNDPQRATAMGHQGRQYFEENFTLGTIAEQYLSVITKVGDKKLAKLQANNFPRYADSRWR